MPREAQKELRLLGHAIRKGREKMGLSQEDFAELSQVHRTYIGQLERGEKNVSFSSLLRVCQALRTTPSELFGNAGL